MVEKSGDTPIRLHRQVMYIATPYDTEWLDYFDKKAKKLSFM